MDQAKALKAQLKDLLAQWCMADNKRKFYGVNAPQAKSVLDDIVNSFNLVITKAKKISFIRKDSDLELLVGDEAFLANSLQTDSLVAVIVESLQKAQVNSVTFFDRISVDDLDVLFTGLSKPQEELEKQGALSGFLKDNNISSIEVDLMHFELLKDGQAIGQAGRSGGDLNQILGEMDSMVIDPNKKISKKVSEGESSFAWQNYMQGGLSQESFSNFYKGLIESGKGDLSQISNSLKDIAGKQKDIESFLAEIEKKLLELGFEENQINEIKKDLKSKKQVTVSEVELDRLRKIEKDFQNSLEERVDNALKEVKRVNQKLTDEKERIRSILTQNSQGVIVVDKQGKVLSLNSFAEKAIGYSLKDSQKKDIKDLIKEGRAVSITDNWQEETDDFIPKMIKMLSTDNEAQDIISQSSAVIENEDGKAIGTVASLHNISELQQMKRRRNEMVEMLGHDLRAPITAAKQNLAVLMGIKEFTENISDEHKGFLERCKRSVEKMEGMVRTIIDVRQLETGKISLRKEDINLVKLVSDATESLETWAKDKGIELKFEKSDPVFVNADQERIYQVVINLITNAIKFTPDKGRIDVKVSLEKQDLDSFVTVSVSDTGVGIKEVDIGRIFNKYEQITIKVPTGQGGLGLGLAICKSIIELHKGKIWVESSEGKGSTFSFKIPCNG